VASGDAIVIPERSWCLIFSFRLIQTVDGTLSLCGSPLTNLSDMRETGRHAGVVALLQRRLGSDVVHPGRGEERQATVVTLNVGRVVL
jgi:hypothetical protein